MSEDARFKPFRAGIINLWDYVREEFRFADGRLLLRGPNGSGKTKALEVLFPFVLDGRTDARRLDPYSGDERTMKENLLYRGQDTAYGYAWMEFARGAERVCVGVGLRAQRHAEGVKPWFFVTDKVLGSDFDLVDGENRPLTHKGLTDALGADSVLERATDYRARINQRLFGLADDRYEGMLSLVLTLRKPKIAEKLDPDELSSILSRGLRPLDDETLDRAAMSFEDLEAVQRELERLIAAHEELERFLALYRAHVRVQARHCVDTAVSAAGRAAEQISKVEGLERAANEAVVKEAGLKGRVERIKGDLVRARSRRDALKDSAVYHAAGQLVHLEGRVGDARSTETGARNELGIVQESVEDLARKATTAGRLLSEARSAAANTRSEVASNARECGLAWTGSDAGGTSDEIRQRLSSRLAARREDLRVVRGCAAQVGAAATRVAHAESTLEAARSEVQRAQEGLKERERAADVARENLLAGLREWATARPAGLLTEDDVPSLEATVPLLGEDDSRSLGEVLSQRFAERRAVIASELAVLDRRLDEIALETKELEAQRAEILSEKDDAPRASPTRPADREGRPGAPLWRLVRFRPGLGRTSQAGIEAALEAAGLLDAWISPSGDAAEAGILDAYLVPDPRPEGVPALFDVLEPEDQPHVPRERVDALLRTVALGDAGSTATIDSDGTYRLGPLVGAFVKEGPQFIGATARAERRRQRIAELDQRLRGLAEVRARLEEEQSRLKSRRADFDQAAAELPATGPVIAAVRTVVQAAGILRGARQGEENATGEWNRWRRTLGEYRTALMREATNRALPAEQEALDAVAGALERLAREGERLVGLQSQVEDRDDQAQNWRSQHERRVEDKVRAEATLKAGTTARERLEVELKTLRATIGAEADDVLRQVADVESDIARLDGSEEGLGQEYKSAGEARVRAKGDWETERSTLENLRRESQDALSGVVPFGHRELAAVLGIDAEVSAAALAAAPQIQTPSGGGPIRSLVAALDKATQGVSPTEDRRKAALTQVHNGFQQLITRLGPAYRADLSLDEEIVQVSIADDEGVQPVAAFTAKLEKLRREQELLLTTRERELFEDTLLGSLCRQIHARTGAARELVRQMDQSMRQRRMSSQKTVGVTWEMIDSLTPDQRRAARLLEHEPAHLSPDQLDELRRYFRSEVKSARAADPGRAYRQILGSVLDYRAWRRFVLHLVGQDGSEAPLTRARHAKLSTGEKAISLYLPLFGAAHAQFLSALSTCPRLIALDEAFATIDANGKPALLALSVEFDLDLFMTGYDLWVSSGFRG